MSYVPKRAADRKKLLRKAKIAVTLRDELGRVPNQEEIEQVFLLIARAVSITNVLRQP
jgi:hypothetical protein